MHTRYAKITKTVHTLQSCAKICDWFIQINRKQGNGIFKLYIILYGENLGVVTPFFCFCQILSIEVEAMKGHTFNIRTKLFHFTTLKKGM